MSTEQPAYESDLLGFKVIVWPNRVQYRRLWGVLGDQVIPAGQIASVQESTAGVQEITLETTGGKKYPLVVPLSKKHELVEQILAIVPL